MILWYLAGVWIGLGWLSYLVFLLRLGYEWWHMPRGLRRWHRRSEPWWELPVAAVLCLLLAPLAVFVLLHILWTGALFRDLMPAPPYDATPRWFYLVECAGIDDAAELLYRFESKLTRRLRALIACACCRLIWEQLTDERCRRVVEAAETMIDLPGSTAKASEELTAAMAEVDRRWSWRAVFRVRVCEDCLNVRCAHVVYRVEVLQPQLADTLLVLVRDVVGDPFHPLARRQFPPEVVELARACDAGEPVHGVLADALDELGEAVAAQHCRAPVHVKGCHVVEWVLGRR